MQQDAISVRTRQNTARRQAAADALAASDRSAENDFAQRLPDILHPSEVDANTQRATEAAAQAAADLSPAQAAVRQGRVTRDAFELRTEMALRGLIAAHPGSASVIVDQFRQNNLISPLMREYTQAAEDVRDEQNAYRENEQTLVAYAQNILGLEIRPDMPNQMREQILNTARQHIAAQTQLQQDTARFQYQRSQVNATVEDQNRAREEFSRNALSAGLNASAAELSGLQIAVTQLLDAPDISDTDKQQRLAQLVAQVESGANLRLNQFITQHPDMAPADQSTLRDTVGRYVSSMRDLIAGPNGIVQQRVRTLQLIQANLGINAAQALPFYTQMRNILGNNAAADALFASLAQNPQMTQRIRQELQGYSGLQPGQQAVRMNNIANVIAGRTGIRDYSASEARQMIPTVMSTLQHLSQNTAARTGADPDAHLSGLNAIGQVSNVMIEAVPQWGVEQLAGLTNQMISGRIGGFMFNSTANHDDRINTIHAYIPGMTRVIQSLRAAPTGDANFSVEYNSRLGNFEARPTALHTARGMIRRIFPSAGGVADIINTVVNAAPNAATIQKVNTLNRAIVAMSNIAGNGYDDAVPRQTPARDRMAFYATGVPPASMRQHQGENNNSGRSTMQRLDELQQHIGEWITHMPTTVSGSPSDSPEGAAAVIQGAESHNNPTAQNPRSTATGTGQFTEDTWMGVMREHFPQLIAGKSRAEILAMRNDPNISNQATVAHVRDNMNTLRAEGLPPTGPNAYVLHFFGGDRGGGGVRMLHALQTNPNQPVNQVLSADAMAANPNLWTGTGANRRPKTVGEVIRMVHNTFNNRAERFAGAGAITGREDGGAFAGVQ